VEEEGFLSIFDRLGITLLEDAGGAGVARFAGESKLFMY
jgi:hypothetical protein